MSASRYVNHKDGREQDRCLKVIEIQCHGLSDHPSKQYNKRGNKQCNLLLSNSSFRKNTMDDPTATPTAKSILFLYATVTAVTCYCQWCDKSHTSAAFPTIGNTIRPMNVVDTPDDATIASIELTRNSAQTATIPVDKSSKAIAMRGVISAISSDPSDSSSEVESSYKCACVFNWKKRYLVQLNMVRGIREVNQEQDDWGRTRYFESILFVLIFCWKGRVEGSGDEERGNWDGHHGCWCLRHKGVVWLFRSSYTADEKAHSQYLK